MTAPEDRGETAPWWVTAIILTVAGLGTLAWVALATLWAWPLIVGFVVEYHRPVLLVGFVVVLVLGGWGMAREEKRLAAQTAAVRDDLARGAR